MNNNGILIPGPRFQKSHGEHDHAIKMALFDVDNTLVGNDSSGLPSERFKRAVQTAQQAGIKVALASARPIAKVAHILEYVEADGLSILSNGAQIVNSRDRSVVAEWPLDPISCLAMIAGLDKLGVTYWINDDGTDYFPSATRNGASDGTFERQVDIWNPDSARLPAPDYKPRKPFVIDAHNITAEQAAIITKLVDGLGDPNLTTLFAHETTQPDGSKLYDQFIADKRANKLHALHEVSRLQNIPLENFLAVGDGRNDAVLVGAAGVGVAMGNSAQETLDVAAFIAPNRQDDGAAIAMEQFT